MLTKVPALTCLTTAAAAQWFPAVATKAAAAAPTPLAELPLLELARIMFKLPVSDRARLATVCKRFAEAAALATPSVEKGHLVSTASLDLWMKHHGTNLEALHLQLGAPTGLNFSLYFAPSLCSVVLHRVFMQLGPESAVAAALDTACSLTRLTSLSLVDVVSHETLMRVLKNLPSLQDLTLCHLSSGRIRCPAWNVPCLTSECCSEFGAALQQLPQLTRLVVNKELAVEALRNAQHTANMQHLSLSLLARPFWPAKSWMPEGLRSNYSALWDGLQELRHLTGLTTLQLLELPAAHIPTEVVMTLGSLTNLQELWLTCDNISWDHSVGGFSDAQPSILAGMPNLQQLLLARLDWDAADLLTALPAKLTKLTLDNVKLDSAMQAYSALTFSSNIQVLDLSRTVMRVQLPEHVADMDDSLYNLDR